MLNTADPITIGANDGTDEASKQQLLAALDGNPRNGTPLLKHLKAVRDQIAIRAKDLQLRDQKAVVIIYTDGLPTDGGDDPKEALYNALLPFFELKLPVKFVVRICSGDDGLVKFWEDIDDALDLDIDVLDDVFSEGLAVEKANPWLTYGPPLHLVRELGSKYDVFDRLDEGKLSADDMVVLCTKV